MKKVLLIVFLSLPLGLCLAQETFFVTDDNNIRQLRHGELSGAKKKLRPKAFYKILNRSYYKSVRPTNSFAAHLAKANVSKGFTSATTDSIFEHFTKYALQEKLKSLDRKDSLSGKDLSEYEEIQVIFREHLILLGFLTEDIKDWRMINEVDDNIDLFIQKQVQIENDFKVINNHYLEKVKKEEALRAIMAEYEDLTGVLVYYYRQVKFYVDYEESILARNTYQTGIDKTKIAKEVVKDMWKK